MIVKQIESQTREPNYFQALISYLLNPQGKEHRVGDARFSNYLSNDLVGVRFETQVLQKQNTRAKSSDTMHLVLSFPEGEIPSKEVLEKIEERMVASLGMEDHQRISVTHSDTDHFHLHIAINKIHPVSHNLISPAFSWTALSKCALQCEEDFKLSHDNHVVQRVLFVDGKPVTENYEPSDDYIKNQKARDMEHKEGIESVTRFLKTQMLPFLLEAKTWQDFNSQLKDKGLLIQVKGNGFVFKTDDGTVSVKASSISRELGFEKLSKRLGPFEPYDPNPKEESKWKKKGPSALYLRYLDERNALWLDRKVKTRDEAFRAREEAKSRYRLALMSIKQNKSKFARDLFKAKAFESYQKELEAIAETQKKTYERFLQEKPLGWKAWVQKKALDGDIEALRSLRNKDIRLRKALSIRSEEPCKLLLESVERDSVTKSGTIVYRCGDTTLKDSGQTLTISNDYERNALIQALIAAKEKFGDSPLILNGSDEFKNDLLVVAASMNINLQFHNKTLQSSYEKLKEIENERRNNSRGFGNRTTYRTNIRSEFRTHLYADLPEDMEKLSDESIARVLLSNSKGEVQRDTMFEMSQSSLDRSGKFDLLQMQSIVRSDLSISKTQQHSSLRHISNPDERECERQRVCIENYVQRRNEKRKFVGSILEHRTYPDNLKSTTIFKGLRHVDGVSMVLLQKDEIIYVKAIPNAQVNFVKTLPINAEIEIDNNKINYLKKGHRR